MGVLRAFIAEHLQQDSKDTWNDLILPYLSYNQKGNVSRGTWRTIEDLDLAALLRVVDCNWNSMRPSTKLGRQTRTWLKEAMDVRNRWAHVPSAGYPVDDEYRDIDTILRLAEALSAPQDFIIEAKSQRSRIATSMAGTAEAPNTGCLSKGTFNPGDPVVLAANPSVRGVVCGVVDGPPKRYLVFIKDEQNEYFEDQLKPTTFSSTPETVDPEMLWAALSALQLRHPSTERLYSLFASRIQFVPYQFRPVVRLIRADRPRLLIADEVGVGKTIEAGLILKELQARHNLKNVLIICPKPLVTERKWAIEMERFDEKFIHLDRAALCHCIEETHLDGEWPRTYSRCILPMSLCDETTLHGKLQGRSQSKGLEELDPPPTFDLLIVDEAHHLRNTDTWTHKTVRFLCQHSEAVVFRYCNTCSTGKQRSVQPVKHPARGSASGYGSFRTDGRAKPPSK